MTGDGGLIALSVAEAERLMLWYVDHCSQGCENPACNPLLNRISEWHRRHLPATSGDIPG